MRRSSPTSAADLAYPADHAAVCEQLAAEGVAVVWTPSIAPIDRVSPIRSTGRRPPPPAANLAVQVVAGATVHPGDDAPVTLVRRAVEDDGAGSSSSTARSVASIRSDPHFRAGVGPVEGDPAAGGGARRPVPDGVGSGDDLLPLDDRPSAPGGGS